MHNCIIYLWFDATEDGDPGTVVKAVCLEKSVIAGSNPTLAFKKTKRFFPPHS